MLITDKRIKVTEQMMFDNGLSFFLTTGRIGVPFSATQKEPITWKPMDWELTDQDFDKIEDYFLANK